MNHLNLKIHQLLVTILLAVTSTVATATERYATFQIVNFGKNSYAATQASVPTGAKLKILVKKRANSELGVYMWDCDNPRGRLLPGVDPGFRTMDGPAKVWQAQPGTPSAYLGKQNRDEGKVADGDVLTYTARKLKTYFGSPASRSEERPVGLAIISCGNFWSAAAQFDVTSCQQEENVFHIKTADGWELDVKIEAPPF